MPVQTGNSKISARPGLATGLLQIFIPTTYCVKKVNLHLSYVLKDGLLGECLLLLPKIQN